MTPSHSIVGGLRFSFLNSNESFLLKVENENYKYSSLCLGCSAIYFILIPAIKMFRLQTHMSVEYDNLTKPFVPTLIEKLLP